MQSDKLQQLIQAALVGGKGQDIRVLDVRRLTDFTDYMIIATGTSNRHVVSLADKVQEQLREHGLRPAGHEGEDVGDWVLLDYVDAVVHIMRPQVRDFYNLEKLWGEDAAGAASGRRSQPEP